MPQRPQSILAASLRASLSDSNLSLAVAAAGLGPFTSLGGTRSLWSWTGLLLSGARHELELQDIGTADGAVLIEPHLLLAAHTHHQVPAWPVPHLWRPSQAYHTGVMHPEVLPPRCQLLPRQCQLFPPSLSRLCIPGARSLIPGVSSLVLFWTMQQRPFLGLPHHLHQGSCPPVSPRLLPADRSSLKGGAALLQGHPRSHDACPASHVWVC